MDGKLAAEETRRMLERTVALLFAFAGLAEPLRGSSRPVRGLVLWILRYAEAIARDFVLETAAEYGVPPPVSLVMPQRQGGDSPADAMRLARSFRALAVLLDRLADRSIGRSRRGVTQAAGLLAALAGLSADPLSAGSAVGKRPCFAAACLSVERFDSS